MSHIIIIIIVVVVVVAVVIITFFLIEPKANKKQNKQSCNNKICSNNGRGKFLVTISVSKVSSDLSHRSSIAETITSQPHSLQETATLKISLAISSSLTFGL